MFDFILENVELLTGIVVVSIPLLYFYNRSKDVTEDDIDWSEVEVTVPVVLSLDELSALTKVEIVEYAAGFGLELKLSWAKKRLITECLANGLISEE
jgi:hypothetical protein